MVRKGTCSVLGEVEKAPVLKPRAGGGPGPAANLIRGRGE